MNEIKEMRYLLENIPNFRQEYYDIILQKSEETYFKDDSGLGYSHIVGFVTYALMNNETCIRAIDNVSKWELLADATDYYAFEVKNEMEKILDEYNIEQIDERDIQEIIDNKEKEENKKLYICINDNVVAINNLDGQAIIEEFDTIDEAIAFLKINDMEIVYEAKLIRTTKNKTLDNLLREKGYYNNIEEKQVRHNCIENIILGLNKYDDNSTFTGKELSKLNYDMLQIASMQIDEIDSLIYKLKSDISYNLQKNKELEEDYNY